MNKKIMAVIMTTALCISSIGFSSFATNDSNQKKLENKERPEWRNDFQKPDNMVMGKITSISENSVTISIAEFKPNNDNNFKPPEKPSNDNNNSASNNSSNNNTPPQPPKDESERQQLTDEQLAEMKKNLENMYTLTGETKTIDISNATFDDFRKIDKKSSDNNSNDNANNNQKTKTYKDYSVGDYISIELESSTSTKAKAVRSSMMPFGRGGKDKPKADKQTNNNSNN